MLLKAKQTHGNFFKPMLKETAKYDFQKNCV